MRLIDTEQLEHRRLYSAGGYSGYDCATWMSINMADEFDLETFEAEIRADERKKMKAIIGRTAENYGPVELGCAWYSLKLVDRIEKVIENYNLTPKHLFKKEAGNAKYYYQLQNDETLKKINDL